MSLFDTSFTGMQHVLDLRAQQHTLTASNLANADTPGYKAKYVDFGSLLSEVMDPASMPKSGDSPSPEIMEVEAPAWSANGNSVFAEQEHARLQANSMLYNGVARGVAKRFALLKFAASDGRR
jgi:flagellar basal-body rod protein FlgB